MNAAFSSGGRPTGSHGGKTQHSGHSDPRDLWPRDFGRDGVSGLVTVDRALRARDVSRPDADDERDALEAVAGLMARVDGRRPASVRTRPGGQSAARDRS